MVDLTLLQKVSIGLAFTLVVPYLLSFRHIKDDWTNYSNHKWPMAMALPSEWRGLIIPLLIIYECTTFASLAILTGLKSENDDHRAITDQLPDFMPYFILNIPSDFLLIFYFKLLIGALTLVQTILQALTRPCCEIFRKCFKILTAPLLLIEVLANGPFFLVIISNLFEICTCTYVEDDEKALLTANIKSLNYVNGTAIYEFDTLVPEKMYYCWEEDHLKLAILAVLVHVPQYTIAFGRQRGWSKRYVWEADHKARMKKQQLEEEKLEEMKENYTAEQLRAAGIKVNRRKKVVRTQTAETVRQLEVDAGDTLHVPEVPYYTTLIIQIKLLLAACTFFVGEEYTSHVLALQLTLVMILWGLNFRAALSPMMVVNYIRRFGFALPVWTILSVYVAHTLDEDGLFVFVAGWCFIFLAMLLFFLAYNCCLKASILEDELDVKPQLGALKLAAVHPQPMAMRTPQPRQQMQLPPLRPSAGGGSKPVIVVHQPRPQ